MNQDRLEQDIDFCWNELSTGRGKFHLEALRRQVQNSEANTTDIDATIRTALGHAIKKVAGTGEDLTESKAQGIAQMTGLELTQMGFGGEKPQMVTSYGRRAGDKPTGRSA